MTLLVEAGGKIAMASSGAAEAFGRSPAELEGSLLPDLVEEPGRAALTAALESLDRGGTGPARVAVTVSARGGGRVEADLRVEPVGRGAGTPTSWIVHVQTLGPSPAQDRPLSSDAAEIVGASHEAVAICRGDVIQEVTGGLADLVGVEAGRMIGWRLRNLVAAEDLLPVIGIIREVERGHRPAAEFGFHLLRSGGNPPLEVSARVRSGERRGSRTLVVGIEDVSERVRLARRAEEALGRLDAALDATSDAVLIVGDAGSESRVLYVSRSFERLFRIRAKDWLGRSFWELWRELRPLHEEPGREEAAWKRLLSPSDAVKMERVRLAGPPERIVERLVRPMRGADGREVGRICSFRDVTTRISAEEKMRRGAEAARQAREELAALNEETRLANEGLEMRMAEMQRLNKDLRTLDEMKSNLLANVSHELQTPLVSIKGFTEMILKGRLGEVTVEQQEGLQVALRNINRLIGLIDNLMTYARSTEPADSLHLGAFPLEEVVGETVRLVEEGARRRGIGITVETPSGLTVRADRDRIVQVLLNLLTNAIKYNRNEGSVIVKAEKRGDSSARVSVKDTGVGIPRDEIEKIFQRNYRAERTRGTSEGAGIGLSIARDILRRHGSLMRVESQVGKGSTFSFTLPLDATAMRAPDAVARTSGPLPRSPR